MSLRLSLVHYRHLILEAERQDVSMAEAVRRMIDAAVDAHPAITDQDGDDFTSYRSLLQVLDDDALEDLAHKLPADAVGTSDDHAGAGGSA
jgi:hypothetical protein